HSTHRCCAGALPSQQSSPADNPSSLLALHRHIGSRATYTAPAGPEETETSAAAHASPSKAVNRSRPTPTSIDDPSSAAQSRGAPSSPVPAAPRQNLPSRVQDFRACGSALLPRRGCSRKQTHPSPSSFASPSRSFHSSHSSRSRTHSPPPPPVRLLRL